MCTVAISVLRDASKFIERFIGNGGDPTTDFATFLRELDITTNGCDPNDIANLLLADTTATFTKFLTRIGIDNALTICDELGASSTIDHIVLQNTLLDKQSQPIINNTIHYSENIFRAYEHGYSVIPHDPTAFDTIHYKQNDASLPPPSQNSASDNGLHCNKIEIDDTNDTNETIAMSETNLKEIRHVSLRTKNKDILDACPNVTSVDLCDDHDTDHHYTYDYDVCNDCDIDTRNRYYDDNRNDYRSEIMKEHMTNKHRYTDNIRTLSNITEIKRFKTSDPRSFKSTSIYHHSLDKTSRSLNISSPSHIWDGEFKKFTNLKKLIVNKECKYITTCEHVASTLKIIDLFGNFSIRDHGLRLCKVVKELNVKNNPNIETCNPFAKTLKVLNASGRFCGLSNDSINMCKKLRKLNVRNNHKITTCNPFAATLICLDASNASGIADDGLVKCINLRKLNASNNDRISTCIPFANTIKRLDASRNCRIDDRGLHLCSKLEYLDVSNNFGICTCKPFGNTLVVLRANGSSCGMWNEGIRWCNKLKILHARNNHRMCTCISVGQTLEILDASCSPGYNCGIKDDGLKTCTKLKKLNASNNWSITTCAPFAQTLEVLCIDGSRSRIPENELNLCANIRVVFADNNNDITAHRYLCDGRNIPNKYKLYF